MNAQRPAWVRAFIAIPLPEEVRAAIGRAQAELRRSIRGGAVRWTPPEQIHLTLRFLGDVPADSVAALEAALRRGCAGAAALELRAGGIGAFPDTTRPRVLWTGLSGQLDRLRELHRRIVSETKTWGDEENREFHPHLTLGRVKDARPAELCDIRAVLAEVKAGDLGFWTADSVELMRSELSPAGAKHSCLARVSLERRTPGEPSS